MKIYQVVTDSPGNDSNIPGPNCLFLSLEKAKESVDEEVKELVEEDGLYFDPEWEERSGGYWIRILWDDDDRINESTTYKIYETEVE